MRCTSGLLASKPITWTAKACGGAKRGGGGDPCRHIMFKARASGKTRNLKFARVVNNAIDANRSPVITGSASRVFPHAVRICRMSLDSTALRLRLTFVAAIALCGRRGPQPRLQSRPRFGAPIWRCRRLDRPDQGGSARIVCKRFRADYVGVEPVQSAADTRRHVLAQHTAALGGGVDVASARASCRNRRSPCKNSASLPVRSSKSCRRCAKWTTRCACRGGMHLA